jgi:hypothetical protein
MIDFREKPTGLRPEAEPIVPPQEVSERPEAQPSEEAGARSALEKVETAGSVIIPEAKSEMSPAVATPEVSETVNSETARRKLNEMLADIHGLEGSDPADVTRQFLEGLEAEKK